MCSTSLDFVFPETSAGEPWSCMMDAVRQYAESTSLKDFTNPQKDDIQLSCSELFPSNELRRWAPQMATEKTLPDDQRATSTRTGTDNAKGYCATSFNPPFDGDETSIKVEVRDSPTSSLSIESVSCYSSTSEDTNSNGSETTFGSLSEDDSKAHVEISSFFESLVADKERDDHINKLAEEFERDWGFNFEFLTKDATFPGPSAVMDCDEAVEAPNMEESVLLSRRSSEGGDCGRSFTPLFEGEDGMIEFETLVDDDPALGDSNDQSHDINFLDQARREKQLLAAQRHSRAIQLNPFLSHLFDY